MTHSSSGSQAQAGLVCSDRVPAKIGLECLSVCLTHHRDSTTTICLTLGHSSSCAVSFSPGAGITHESPRGLHVRSFDDNCPACCSTNTLWSWAHLIENLLLLPRKAVFSVYFTQTALLQILRGYLFCLKRSFIPLIQDCN